jgi:hypothetical protein
MNKKNNKKAATIKEVLIATRWILENVGWCQRALFKNKAGEPIFNGRHPSDIDSACLLGAVWLVESDVDFLKNKTMEFIITELNIQYDTMSMSSWNDDPKRTKNQVLSFLDKIIKEA